MPTGRAAIRDIVSRLEETYPGATYALDWTTPWELLVGSILAAQSSDAHVNTITPGLFAKYKDVHGFARASVETLTEEIRSCGLGPTKAKGLVACAQAIVERFGGEVPRTMAELLTLPRVQRKTANVVLNTAFKTPEGIIVDLHVARVAPRLGLSTHEDPVKIERDLMEIVPREDWGAFGAAVILHGREVCRPTGPNCGQCVLEPSCAKNLAGVAPGDGAPQPTRGAKPGAKKEAPAKREEAPPKREEAPVMEAAEPEEAASPTAGHRPSGARGGALKLPPSWQSKIGAELTAPYFQELSELLREERAKHEVFPPEDEVFTAFELAPFDRVKVVLLGQDPYHDVGQAHGLCFSVKRGVKPPPSLMNMFRELKADLGIPIAGHGFLEAWAKQGVLMLNAVLTVRAHQANSHKDRGWERFTDAVIRAVNSRPDPVVFALWGGYAQKKGKIVDEKRHVVLKGAHPSPLSVKQFMGSKPFSAINAALEKHGKTPIDWRLP